MTRETDDEQRAEAAFGRLAKWVKGGVATARVTPQSDPYRWEREGYTYDVVRSSPVGPFLCVYGNDLYAYLRSGYKGVGYMGRIDLRGRIKTVDALVARVEEIVRELPVLPRKLKPGAFYWAMPAFDVDRNEAWWNALQPARFDGYVDGVEQWVWLGTRSPVAWPAILIKSEIVE